MALSVAMVSGFAAWWMVTTVFAGLDGDRGHGDHR
jgi:hypothetical protein